MALKQHKYVIKKKMQKGNEPIKADPSFHEHFNFIEDLTEVRRRLLKTVREISKVEFAIVMDGASKVETADDLYKLRAESVDYAEFYK